ncbi:FISUMP domain-containing protein [Flavobacterium sp. GB2R13]|uniref:FISUMP domain-containing protein n=1 Tax=Flavobacterium algoris TaxID=3398733 RepID=UPI003A83D0C0
MKKISGLLTVSLLLLGALVFAQKQQKIGDNTTNIAPNAVLELESSTSGFLPPRMNHEQRNAVSASPGLMIYCTDCGDGQFQVFTNVNSWSGINSVVDVSSVPCGAYVTAGVYKKFMCYNLGATNTLLDPNIPVQAIHGNYYQWGRSAPVANASTSSAAITGWNSVNAANGSWADGSKTAYDPCPVGFRVPTKVQWDGVLANNTVSRTGSWTNDGNFSTAISWGPNASTKTLTLPAAGYRIGTDGTLLNRGGSGFYWSSTESSTYAGSLAFGGGSASTTNTNRTHGLSVRCVSE